MLAPLPAYRKLILDMSFVEQMHANSSLTKLMSVSYQKVGHRIAGEVPNETSRCTWKLRLLWLVWTIACC